MNRKNDIPDEHELEFLLSQYIDGQLDEPRQKDLQRRLQTDDALSEQLRRYERLDALLGQTNPAGLAEADFHIQRSQIRSQLERDALLGHHRHRVLRPVMYAVTSIAAAIVVAVSAWVLTRSDAPVDPTGSGPGRAIVHLAGPEGQLAHAGVPLVALAGTPADESGPAVAPRASLPRGTIVVNVAPHPRRPRLAARDNDTMLLE